MIGYLSLYGSTPLIQLNYPRISGCGLSATLNSLNQFPAYFFSSSPVTDVGAKLIAQFPNLTSLDISGSAISNEGFEDIMRNLLKLRELKIHKCKWNSSALRAAFCSELRIFHAQSVEAFDDLLAEEFARVPHLEDLNLSSTKVGDKTIRCVTKYCTKIRKLHLDYVKTTQQALIGKSYGKLKF